MINVSFDPQIKNANFSKVSGAKGQRLGYYRLHNKYVFGFEANHLDKKFFTKPKEILKIFQQAQISQEDINCNDSEKDIANIQYLQKIESIIDKHNHSLDKAKKKLLFRFLLVVPFIKNFVKKYFEHLKTFFPLSITLFSHTYKSCFSIDDSTVKSKIDLYLKENLNFPKICSELEKFKKFQNINKWKSNQEIINNEFSKPKSPIALKKIKNQLLESIKENQNQFGCVCEELKNLEIWNQAKTAIIESYEKKLKEYFPIIEIAEKISQEAKETPDLFFQNHLNISESSTLFEVEENFKKVQKSFSEDIENYSSTLSEKVKEAKNRLSEYYFKKWIPQTIDRLIKNPSLIDSYFTIEGWENIENRKIAIENLIDQWSKKELLNDESVRLEEFKQKVQASWIKKINTDYPSIALAEKVLTASAHHSESIYTLIDISENDPITDVVTRVNFALRTLSDIKDLPKEQQKLLEQAKQFVKKGYGQWLVKKVSEIEKKFSTREQILNEILGPERSRFQTRYKSISAILNQDFPEFRSSLRIIAKHYETFLEKEIEAVLPLIQNQFADLQPDLLFGDAKAYSKMLEKKELLILSVKEWEEFQKTQQEIVGEGIQLEVRARRAIDKAIDAVLRAQYPAFRLSKEVTDVFIKDGAPSSGQMLDNPEDYLANLKNEAWYRKKLLEFDTLEKGLKVDSNIPEIVKQTFGVAAKILKQHYARLETSRLKKLPKKIPRTEQGFFGKITSFFRNVDVSYLDEYKINLMMLLGIKKPEEIEDRYEELIKILSYLPSSKEEWEKVKNAYDDYKRSLELRPLLTLIFNKKTLAFSDIFPKVPNPNRTNIVELDQTQNHLIHLLNLEIKAQENRENQSEKVKILEILASTQNSIVFHFKNFVRIYIPGLYSAREILEKIKNLKDNPASYSIHDTQIYETILDITRSKRFKLTSSEVLSYKERELKKLSLENEESFGQETQSLLTEAKEWIEIAYKLWEADRILDAHNRGATREKIHGTYSYHRLSLLLHSDKNIGVIKPLQDRMSEAYKVIVHYNPR